MLSNFLSPSFYYICPAVQLQLLKIEQLKKTDLSVFETSKIGKFLILISTSFEPYTKFEQESFKK